jgi:hypothetical protein
MNFHRVGPIDGGWPCGDEAREAPRKCFQERPTALVRPLISRFDYNPADNSIPDRESLSCFLKPR